MSIYTLGGGIAAWRERRWSSWTVWRALFLPLERQVMLGAGLLVLAGVLLGAAGPSWLSMLWPVSSALA